MVREVSGEAEAEEEVANAAATAITAEAMAGAMGEEDDTSVVDRRAGIGGESPEGTAEVPGGLVGDGAMGLGLGDPAVAFDSAPSASDAEAESEKE